MRKSESGRVAEYLNPPLQRARYIVPLLVLLAVGAVWGQYGRAPYGRAGNASVSGSTVVTPANYPEWQSGLDRYESTIQNTTQFYGGWREFSSGVGPGLLREIRLEVRQFDCAGCVNSLDSLWITIRSGVDTLDPALVRGVYTGVDSFRVSDFLWVPATPPADARYQTRYVTYKDTTADGTRFLSILARVFIYVPDTFSIWLRSEMADAGIAGSVVFETGQIPVLGGMRYFHVDDVAIDTMPNAKQSHWMGPLFECSGLGAGYIGAAHWTGIMEAAHQEFARYSFADHDMPYTTVAAVSRSGSVDRMRLGDLSGFSFDYPWPFLGRYRNETRMYLTDGSNRDSAETVLVSTYLGYPEKVWKTDDSLWVTTRATHAAGDTLFELDAADWIDISQNHAVVDVSSTYARFSQDWFSGNAKLTGNISGTVPHSWLVFYSSPFDSTAYVYGAMSGSKDAGVGPTRSVVYSWTEQQVHGVCCYQEQSLVRTEAACADLGGVWGWPSSAACYALTPSADTLDFGYVTISDDSTQTLWIYSTGLAAAVVDSLTGFEDDGAYLLGFTTDFSGPDTIPAGDSLAVEITFTPLVDMVYGAGLHVHYLGATEPDSVWLTGHGGKTADSVYVSSGDTWYQSGYYQSFTNWADICPFNDVMPSAWLYGLLAADTGKNCFMVYTAAEEGVSGDKRSGILVRPFDVGSIWPAADQRTPKSITLRHYYNISGWSGTTGDTLLWYAFTPVEGVLTDSCLNDYKNSAIDEDWVLANKFPANTFTQDMGSVVVRHSLSVDICAAGDSLWLVLVAGNYQTSCTAPASGKTRRMGVWWSEDAGINEPRETLIRIEW
ncbi:MAG: hypothetical protein PHI18_00225 [bacterium]|nr:hypothetical protein [bacterium]